MSNAHDALLETNQPRTVSLRAYCVFQQKTLWRYKCRYIEMTARPTVWA